MSATLPLLITVDKKVLVNLKRKIKVKTQKDNSDNKIGIIATISVFSAVVIGGVVLIAKNKLNKKVKK